jgi:hypothetical protein
MERPTIIVPQSLLTSLDFTWDIAWRGQSVGETNSGFTQSVYNAFPRWVGTPSVFLQDQQLAQWRAIRAEAQGMVGIYKIEMDDPIGYNGTYLPNGIPFSEGVFFSNGYGFSYDPTCTAVTAVAAGATSLRIDVTDTGAAPNEGQIMSHNDWPFMVTSVLQVSQYVYDITLQMPLRSAIAADDTIELQGVGLFEAVEESMGNPVYTGSYASIVKLNFREVLNR